MDDKIKEVMDLISEWGMASHLNGEAALDAHNPEATPDEIVYADECQDRERSAWKAIESKLRELVPVWLPIESAEKPAIGANGFGERVLLLVDCGDGTLKSTKIGWWCDKWMMDTGGSVKENGYRAIGWMPLP